MPTCARDIQDGTALGDNVAGDSDVSAWQNRTYPKTARIQREQRFSRRPEDRIRSDVDSRQCILLFGEEGSRIVTAGYRDRAARRENGTEHRRSVTFQ